jgi:hypothetical protein
MAILKGFPPSNTISPSVRITEKDLSFIAPEQSFHRAGIVGFASKGPINIPTMVSSRRQLNTLFGYPHPESGDPYLIYAAEQYLLVATELYIVRVADTDAVSSESVATAFVELPSAGGQIRFIGSGGPFRFNKTSYFKWKLNGVLASKTLVVLADADHPDPLVQANGYSVDQLVEDLNSQLLPEVDGIQFYKDTTTTAKIGLRTVFSFGPESSLEIVSVQDSIAGGSTTAIPDSNVNVNVTGLGQGMTFAQVTGGKEETFDFSISGDLFLNVVVDGTDNVNVDNVVQTVDFSNIDPANIAEVTADEVVDYINDAISNGDISGGFEAVKVADRVSLRTLHHGRDARIFVKNDSTLLEVLGFDNVLVHPTADPNTDTVENGTARGTTPRGVTGDVNISELGIVSGNSNTTGETSLTVFADSPGVDGNATQVVVRNNIREGNFILEVYNNGVQLESWGNLTKDETSRFYVCISANAKRKRI